MKNSNIDIIYQPHIPQPNKITKKIIASHHFRQSKNNAEDYLPLHISIWERLLGPGTIAASVVCMILMLMALCMPVTPIKESNMIYTQNEKLPEVVAEEEPELHISEHQLTFEEDGVDKIVHKNIEVKIVSESHVDETFRDVQSPFTETARVNFNHLNVLDGLGTTNKPPDRRGQRRNERQGMIRENGGSFKTEKSVTDALHWLRRHQESDGRWSLHDYRDRCGRENKRGVCYGRGQNKVFDIGGTALCLLAYTGRGHDHTLESPFKKSIARTVKYLKSSQSHDGLFGKKLERHYIYNHILSTFALADLYLMSEDKKLLEECVTQGVRYLERVQNPGLAWRYNYKIDGPTKGLNNDTSVTTWAVMALKTARETGITVDDKCFTGASKWLDYCYEEESSNRLASYGYVKVDGKLKYLYDRPFASTACGMLTRQFLNETKGVKSCVKLLMQSLPKWTDERNIYYWYHGSLALFQIGGDAWEKWNEALKPTLTKNQCRKRSHCSFGSWTPQGDAYGVKRQSGKAGYGGRIYSTAMGALTLEVYYRYERISYKNKQKVD